MFGAWRLGKTFAILLTALVGARHDTTGLWPETICATGAPVNGVYQIDAVAYDGNEWLTTASVRRWMKPEGIS